MRRKIVGTMVAFSVAASSLFASNPNINEKLIKKIQDIKLLKQTNVKVYEVNTYKNFYVVQAIANDNGQKIFIMPIITKDFSTIIMGNAFGADDGKLIKPKVNPSIAVELNKANAISKMKQQERLKAEKKFTLNPKYYNKEHLLLGYLNAKNKVLVISDPLCIACIKTFPPIYNGIEKAIQDGKSIALFYYHYPLKMHPTAPTIAKAIKLATKNGYKDVVKKILFSNFDEEYDVYKSKDNKNALKEFNKIIGTKYTLDDLKNISLTDGVEIAKSVKLNGTPTILVNGKLYNSRQKLQKLLSD